MKHKPLMGTIHGVFEGALDGLPATTPTLGEVWVYGGTAHLQRHLSSRGSRAPQGDRMRDRSEDN